MGGGSEVRTTDKINDKKFLDACKGTTTLEYVEKMVAESITEIENYGSEYKNDFAIDMEEYDEGDK